MVKFSNIFKLWNVAKEEDATKDKQAEKSPDSNLKIPAVSQTREMEIKNDSPGKNIPQKSTESIKYSDMTQTSASSLKSQNEGAAVKSGIETPAFKDITAAKLKEPENTNIAFKREVVTSNKPEQLDSAKPREQDSKSMADALLLYDKLYTMNQYTLNVINNKLPLTYINIKEIAQLLKEIVASIQNNPAFIDLTYRESKETYLVSHQVNVTLISMVIGFELGYDRMRLEDLSLAAFFHDIGMQELLFLVEKKEKLSESEYERVRNHIGIGIKILQQIPELPSFVIDVCSQHHERLGGSGHLSLEESIIHEHAQIIGLVDTFESLTHNRSYRTAKTVQNTLRELTQMTDTDFPKKALKILIRKIGIYPVGTFVLLNTQEVAEVIKINEKFPLRPLVKIVYQSGDKLISSKTLDLLANQTFYITATLTKKEALSQSRN